MRLLAGLAMVLALSVVRGDNDDPEFCQRGFQIAGKFHQCWDQATFANKYPPLYEKYDVYTSEFVEKYATHMCSVVKPDALDCLREEVAECSNSEKLISIADESGGACEGNHLNPFFKIHIIDHLKPVSSGSPCFNIADRSYHCYVEAGEKIVENRFNMMDISKFHIVADKFFDYIWDCQIREFKSTIDICENWQIPMLLALQKMAMPSLFGMRLTTEQVAKLELQKPGVIPTRVPSENPPTENGNRFFILLKVLAEPTETEDGDVLLQVDTHDGELPEVSVARGNVHDGADVSNFVGQIVDTEKVLTLKEARRVYREQRRKNKELKEYINALQKVKPKGKTEDEENGKKKDKENGKNDGKLNDKANKDEMESGKLPNIIDSMID